MSIDKITICDAKGLISLLNSNGTNNHAGLNSMLGKKVIIRTYSAGVWFGELSEKSGNEVILTDARRMYQWWAKKSISLSACAKYGVKQDQSKIIEAVESVWLEAIEIIPCSTESIETLEGAENVEAE